MRGDPTYSRVSPRFWTEATRDGWTDDMKLLGLYLLTCPHRKTEGLYLLPLGYVAEDLGWSGERLSASLAQLLQQGFAEYDTKARVVFLPHALKYQRPDNQNQITHAVKSVLDLPDTHLKNRLLAAAFEYAQAFAQALQQALPQAFTQGYTDPPAPAPAPTTALKNPFARSFADASRPGDDNVSTCLAQPKANGKGKAAKDRDADETFVLFYTAYPRHVARRAAERIWGRLTASERQEALAVAEHMAEVVTANGCELRFVPYPATWLNQRRFEDWRDGVPIEYQSSNGKPSAISALQRAYEMTEDEA